MKVIIDVDACVCSGSCVIECPEVFAQDPVEGTVVLLTDVVGTQLLDSARNAAGACPASVITLE